MDLDDMAHTARVDLHASVNDLAVPAPASPRHRRAISVVATAALLALLVGAVAWRSGPSSQPAVAGTDGERHFLPAYVPSGMKPNLFMSSGSSTALDNLETVYLGETSRSDPFDRRDIVVTAFFAPSATPADDGTRPTQGGPGEETIQVRGRSGTFRSGDKSAGFTVNIAQFEVGDASVSMASRHLGRDELVAPSPGLV